VSLEANANLLVAALDLKLVQLLRGAIRAADQGARSGLPFQLTPTPEPRPHIHPQPVFEPRPHIHPTPYFERRPVYHPTPRYEQAKLACKCQEPQEVVVNKPAVEQPLSPPWKTKPWENPPQPAPKVKVTKYRPDIVHKGSLLDFFV